MPRRASKGHSVSPTMTKKKPPSQRETLKPPTIPRNAMGRRDARDSGFITGWSKNRKRGAPLKIAPRTTTNKKKKEKKTTASPSVAAMVSQSPHPRQSPLPPPMSILQALMGRPLPLHQGPNGRRNIQGMLRKILVFPTQSQHPNRLHARSNTTIGKLNPSNQRWPVPSKKN